MDETGKLSRADHDLIVELGTDMAWVKVQLSNHLQHHRTMSMALIAINGSLVVGLIIALLT